MEQQDLCTDLQTRIVDNLQHKATPETQVNRKESETNSYLLLIQEIRLKFLSGVWGFCLVWFVFQEEENPRSQDEEMSAWSTLLQPASKPMNKEKGLVETAAGQSCVGAGNATGVTD